MGEIKLPLHHEDMCAQKDKLHTRIVSAVGLSVRQHRHESRREESGAAHDDDCCLLRKRTKNKRKVFFNLFALPLP